MRSNYFYPILGFIMLDQACKAASLYRLLPTKHLLFFSFTLVKNPGISFGWLQSLPYGVIAFIQAMVLIVVYRLALPRYVKILCLAGGISNLIDRLLHAAIIDYIHLSFRSWQWPTVINLADIYLSIAIFAWIISFSPLDFSQQERYNRED